MHVPDEGKTDARSVDPTCGGPIADLPHERCTHGYPTAYDRPRRRFRHTLRSQRHRPHQGLRAARPARHPRRRWRHRVLRLVRQLGWLRPAPLGPAGAPRPPRLPPVAASRPGLVPAHPAAGDRHLRRPRPLGPRPGAGRREFRHHHLARVAADPAGSPGFGDRTNPCGTGRRPHLPQRHTPARVGARRLGPQPNTIGRRPQSRLGLICGDPL